IDDDEPAERPNPANGAAQNASPPVFNTFPQPAPQRSAPPPPASAAPTSTVTAPVGAAVPGMVVATPQVPGQTAGQPAPTSPRWRGWPVRRSMGRPLTNSYAKS